MTQPAIGALRTRLTLEAAVDTTDAAGGVLRLFVPIGEVFANVEPRRRRETVTDGRSVGELVYRITIRYRDDVDGAMRFTDDARSFRILSVEPLDQTKRFLVCWCEVEQS